MEDPLVIVIDKGIVSEIYSPDANLKIVIVDLDNKRIGEDYISESCWPETQYDDERVNELLNKAG
jgi:hypothetical protein